jgi:hypothetical protein
VNSLIRVGHSVVSTAAKRGTSSANGEYIELPQKESRWVADSQPERTAALRKGKARC